LWIMMRGSCWGRIVMRMFRLGVRNGDVYIVIERWCGREVDRGLSDWVQLG
jgi:hypothetical protein